MPDGREQRSSGFEVSDEGDVMAGDRRIARTDSALPDWYASDTHYRPIPIVWFAGALVLQVIVQPALLLVAWWLLGLPRSLVLALSLVASGFIWRFTWQRGMAQAALGWRASTVLMLAFFLAITALGLLS